MSTGMQTIRDLAEEAKKRVVILLICVFGLSYLMSLTSSSVWVNFPAAFAVIIFGLYLSHDLDMRRRSAMYNKLSLADESSRKRSVELLKYPLEDSDWKAKVNSPVVEEAIEHFTRHLVSEWVTDLWYSKITLDRDGPEELVKIMNGVLGEISSRARDVNLVDLLTRDVINLICNHLELYRYGQAKVGKEEFIRLSVDQRDRRLSQILAAENKLHPLLFSPEAQHKVLQHLVSGIISLSLKPEDLRCSFFRYIARELLACVVLRPVLNLVNPRFVNERIEVLALSSANKAGRGAVPSSEEAIVVKKRGLSNSSNDQVSGLLDLSSPGVELVRFKHDNSAAASNSQGIKSGTHFTKKANDSIFKAGMNEASLMSRSDNFPSVKSESRSSNVQSLYPSTTSISESRKNEGKSIGTHTSVSEWPQKLNAISQRKAQNLAAEHLDNMWAKGVNYRSKESTNKVTKSSEQITTSPNHSAMISGTFIHDDIYINDSTKQKSSSSTPERPHTIGYKGPGSQETSGNMSQEEVEDSESSIATEDDENNTVTGLDTPGTRVWESKNVNSGASRIRHPLETLDMHMPKKSNKVHVHRPRPLKTFSRKRHRPSNQKISIWQEVERTSFPLNDGHDILNASNNDSKTVDMNFDIEENSGRIYSGAAATSSFSSIAASESSYSSTKSQDILVLADTFIKLKCEVLGANIVKSGSGTFAVYSISVTDANHNSWSIKRRYRHFEELHRRLKDFPEYNLNLPPKHFLSSGLDVPVVEERSKLLDVYLKKLLLIPAVSGSIEVWDFLSVDSQTYAFSDSLTIIQTLSVKLDTKSNEKCAKAHSSVEDSESHSISIQKSIVSKNRENDKLLNRNYHESDGLGPRKGGTEQISDLNTKKEHKNPLENGLGNNNLGSGKSDQLKRNPDYLTEKPQVSDADGPSSIPTEWVPPNLSAPILNLVDVVFQLQDGGWIRRQVFWVAKQLLQLGMGDAFDDWLIDKIQLLMKGVVIASAIKRVEQILWPDGIFITKHPKLKAAAVTSPSIQNNNQNNTTLTTEQQQEAARRAKFVHELIIEKAPAALVGLVGRKDYEHCAQDIYFFLQSPVCLKHLTVEVLEIVLQALYPELEEDIRRCHEEKQQFGVFKDDT